MKNINSVEKLAKRFCHKLTDNEFVSAVLIIHEVLNGSHKFDFKPEEEPKSGNYRRYDMDELRTLT